MASVKKFYYVGEKYLTFLYKIDYIFATISFPYINEKLLEKFYFAPFIPLDQMNLKLVTRN